VKAWVQHHLGEPCDVLRIEEVDVPTPGPGQVVLEVAATAVGFSDLLHCRGEYQESTPLPFTPGTEMVGVVSAAGPGTSIGVGERVIALSTGGRGSLGQYALAEANLWFAADDQSTESEAACFLVSFHTGWMALHRRGRVSRGETVLVYSGPGSVGSSTVQLAKAAGARVIAVAGGPTKGELCLRIGADVAIDHSTQDLVSAVRDATGGRGVDVVADPVNGDLFDASRRLIAPEGRVVVLGFASGRIAELRNNQLLLKNFAVMGMGLSYYYANRPDVVEEMHRHLLDLYRQGAVKPLVRQTVDFTEAAAALAAAGEHAVPGRIVVRVSA